MKIKIWIVLSALMAVYSTAVYGSQPGEKDTLSLWVNGLCGMCKERIEDAALQTRGVEEASWDDETRMLRVTVDAGRFKENRLHYRIASVGHDTRQLLAPDPVYNTLPECCRYRDYLTHDHALGEGHQHEDQVDTHQHEDEGAGHEATITGFVFETDEKGKKIPLAGANVYWMGTTEGTITGPEGKFTIGLHEDTHILIVSYVGYGSDTLHLHQPAEVEVGFSSALMLDEVEVTHHKKPTTISFNSVYNVKNIHEKELTKAACCNLSESFETNPSVDVAFTDAVTGTRKIEMLGLAGPYVQITRENMPDIRGLSALYGLTYTPGPWIEGIQLNTGTGSVVNGFESITGQINVELRKPEEGDRLYLNLYSNNAGRMEANLNTNYAISEKWHGGLLLHGNMRPFRIDHNRDGFLDHPAGNQFIALKRFKYSGENGLESQLGFKVTYLDQVGGQVDFDPGIPRTTQSFWGAGMNTRRIEAWAKAGKLFENRPYSSLGFQLSGVLHDQDAYFGLTDYLAQQRSVYSNLIYQSILGNTNHQYRTGISFQSDSYNEELSFGSFDRLEWIPGAFLEYTFNHLDMFTAVAGIRGDLHSDYGAFLTPRLHLRYEPVEKTVIRASAGRGQKTASIFAENIGLFASSRNFLIEGTDQEKPYGLEPEVAWSYGLNFAHGFRLGAGEAVLNLDLYHTRFVNQIVVDLDRDPHEVHFYNLDGASRSNSIQFQLDLVPVARYDIRIAYRYNDVKTTYGDALLDKPLTPKHRAFINMAYTTESDWSFDVTWSWQDAQRIPGTVTNPEPFRLANSSPPFSLVNLQVGKALGKRLELYTGAENLLNFRQEDPIISADDPFGPYFDSSLIWGPVFGRKIYAGMRFRLN